MSTAEQIADEIYGLHCDIGRLETENAELRTQLADVTESMGRVEERCAKLLRLAEDLFRDFVNADDELKLRCGRTYMAWTRYEPRLRKLGAEITK